MDRGIDPAYRRIRWLKRFIMIAAVILLIAALMSWALSWIQPSVRRSLIRTARVDFGTIECGITASGIVEPEQNLVLSSPIEARIIRVLKKPGDLLMPGDSILELDVAGLRLSLDKVRQNIALKRNQRERTRLDLERTLVELKSRCRIKELELQLIQYRATQSKKLFEDGLLSGNDVERLETEGARTEIEREQILESERNAEISSRIQDEGLRVEMDLLEKEEMAIMQDLDLATARVNRRGVLTWVVPEEGVTIRKGDVIARLADLDSFWVEARISDIHANRISIGLPVRVEINEDLSLPGIISKILPSIENGVIAFHVALNDKSRKELHSKLRVDVDIITDRRTNALRISKGPAISGDGTHEVFVVRGSRAVKTAVMLGMAGLSHREIEQGLREGDEVILSDMADYKDLKEIALKK
jgi:HlyD family secretion protein